MKKQNFSFSVTNLVSVFFQNRRFHSILSIFLLFAFLNLTVGCMHYYKVTSNQGQLEQEIERLNYQERFYVVHFGEEVWWLKNLIINEDKTELTGSLEKLPENRRTYLETNPDKVNRYKPKKQRNVLQEVHIYASEYAETGESEVSIPLSSIQKIEVYEHATGAIIASWGYGVALGFGVILLLGIVIFWIEHLPYT